MNKLNFKHSSFFAAIMMASSVVSAEKYEIIEITPNQKFKQHFAMGMNDLGDVVGLARDSFSFPFYLDTYITTENAALRNRCDISQAELDSGNFDATSTNCLKTQLANVNTQNGSTAYGFSSAYQKVGDVRSFVATNNEAEILNIVDVIDEELGDYTLSNNEELTAINNNGVLVGSVSAPYLPQSFTYTNDEGEEVTYRYYGRDFQKRAILKQADNVTLIEPENATYGGVTAAFDISDSGYVAGIESVAINEFFQPLIEGNCDGVQQPVSVCAWSYAVANSVFDLRPVVWQVDENQQVIGKVQYDLAFESDDVQADNYGASAVAVNGAGIAVGYGDVPRQTNSNSVTTFPLIFQDGETKELLPNRTDYSAGYALDINNNNLIVGKLVKFENLTFKDVAFIYDLNSETLTTPTLFYPKSQGVMTAVNSVGYVVGQAQYEATTASVRRKHAFIYNTVNQEIFDLNDLTECNSEYDIVEARDINNNNDVFATAIKMVEKRDANGEVVLDDNGNAEKEQVTVAVLLKHLPAGEVDDCSDLENPPYERQGLSTSHWLLIPLSFLVVLRRRFI